jgi:hypothetical protein
MTTTISEAESDEGGVMTNNIQDGLEKLLAVNRDMQSVMSRTNIILEQMLPAFEALDGHVRDLEERGQESEESRALASLSTRGKRASEKVTIFCN